MNGPCPLQIHSLLHFVAAIQPVVMQMKAKPDEQWLRRQISAYFDSEHELTLDGKTLLLCCCNLLWVTLLITDSGMPCCSAAAV